MTDTQKDYKLANLLGKSIIPDLKITPKNKDRQQKNKIMIEKLFSQDLKEIQPMQVLLKEYDGCYGNPSIKKYKKRKH